jgi:hypothetical protein
MAQRQRSILVFLLYNVAYGMANGRVDNAAHFGGLAFGALSGLALMRAPEQPAKSGRAVLGISGIVAVLCAMGFWATVRVGNDPPNEYNTYITKIHSLLEAQDKEAGELVAELKNSSPDPGRLEAIAARADKDQKELEAFSIKDSDVAAMNRQWISRSQAIATAARELAKQRQRGASGETPDYAEVTKQFTKMKESVESFKTMKAAFFAKYGLTQIK